jgi:hypothetical protein
MYKYSFVGFRKKGKWLKVSVEGESAGVWCDIAREPSDECTFYRVSISKMTRNGGTIALC